MLNFIRVNKLDLSKNAFIKNLNYIKGPFNVVLGEKSGIAMQNKIRRAYHPVTYGISELKLGYNTFIVSNNFLDLTRSIILGDNTIIAGIRTEFWTHGYMHESEGEGRIRIDGEIHLGNNVYVGSRCLFNPSVTIGNSINIGGNSVISKDLNESGMYVNQSLRFLKKDIHSVKQNMTEIKGENLIEKVYIKS
jgi:acetyltransferase-like isoleucine patch superfamily enzyme